uniref:Unannotated protein n=1 Tax=freshwater metagenome TaxID=449393 RepID=A0A6J5ZR15_9ZZZZ
MVKLQSGQGLGFQDCDLADRHWSRLVVAATKPGCGDFDHVVGELPAAGLRGALRVAACKGLKARKAKESLDDVGLCGEELLAPQSKPVNQAVHKTVGAERVEGRGSLLVELEKGKDPLARLGWDLRRFGRRHQRADHVELASPRDLNAARKVDGAEFDRWTRQRPHGRTRVRRVRQETQPGQHVLDLGAAEQLVGGAQLVRNHPFVKRCRDLAPLTAQRVNHHDDRFGRASVVDQALNVGGNRLRFGARAAALPAADFAARPAGQRYRGRGFQHRRRSRHDRLRATQRDRQLKPLCVEALGDLLRRWAVFERRCGGVFGNHDALCQL